MKVLVAVLLAMAFMTCDTVSPVQAATSFTREDVAVKFINSSGKTLRFSIDGRAGPTVPSGDQGFDTTSVGTHTFKAETLDGKQSVSHTVKVTDQGATWTVTPPTRK
jgi:hypothetical protein